MTSRMLALTGPNSGAIVPQEYSHAGLSIPQIASIGRAHWRTGIFIALVTSALVTLVTLVLPKSYTASATVMVNYEVNDPLSGREFPVGLIGSYMATQVELLSRPEVLTQVVEKLQLTQNERFTEGFDGDPRALPAWIARNIEKNLNVRQGQYGSQLIFVTYTASDADDAAKVTNGIVEVYMEQVHQRQTGPAAEHAKRYTKEMAELRDKVVHTQQQLDGFRRRSNEVDIQAKADIDIALLNELEQRLLQAQNARRAAESRLHTDVSVSANVLGSSMVQSLKTQVATLETRLAQLSTTLGPRHPEVIETQSQLSSARGALSMEIGKYQSSTSADLIAARELEEKLAAAAAQQRKKLLDVRRIQDEGSKYVLEFETAQAAYKKALEGYNGVMIASSGQYTNVDFVSRATAPLKPTSPKVLVNILLGIALGGLLGVAIPFVRELLARRVRCRDDLERDHGIPVLVEFDAMPALRSAP
jgi:succinoglycan biosynthesis transport protein ExoP